MNSAALYDDEVVADSEEEDSYALPPRLPSSGAVASKAKMADASHVSEFSDKTPATPAGESISFFTSDVRTKDAISSSGSIPKPRPRPRPAYKSKDSSDPPNKSSDSIVPPSLPGNQLRNDFYSDIQESSFSNAPSIADRAKMRSRDVNKSSNPRSSFSSRPDDSLEIIELSSDGEDELPSNDPPAKKAKTKTKTKSRTNTRIDTPDLSPRVSDARKARPKPRPVKAAKVVGPAPQRLPHSSLPPSDPPQSMEGPSDLPSIAILDDPNTSFDPPSSPLFSPVNRTSKKREGMLVLDELDPDEYDDNENSMQVDARRMPPPAMPPTFFAPPSSGEEGVAAEHSRDLIDLSMLPPTIASNTTNDPSAVKSKPKKSHQKKSKDVTMEDSGDKGKGKAVKGKGKKSKGGPDQDQDAVTVDAPTSKGTKGKGKEKEVFKSREFIDDDEDEDELAIGNSSVGLDKAASTPFITPDTMAPLRSVPIPEPPEKAAGSSKKRKSSGGDEWGGDDEDEDYSVPKKKKVKAKAKVLEPTVNAKGKGKARKVITSEDEDEDVPMDIDDLPTKTAAGNRDDDEHPTQSVQKDTEIPVTPVVAKPIRSVNAGGGVKPMDQVQTTPKENVDPRNKSSVEPSPEKNRSNPQTSTKTPFPSLTSRYTIASRTKSTPMSELIRRVNSHPGSAFRSPHVGSPSVGTAYSPYDKSSRKALSRIAPLHPNRRTPPPPLPPPPPPRKTKKQLELEEKWEDELVEDVGGMTEWLAMSDTARKEMRKIKRDREMGCWED